MITIESDWLNCLDMLEEQPRLAIDLESNSLYAYKESVCLIQVSIPGKDYIIDPLAGLDLSGLGNLLQSPKKEMVFHAAEYDLILLKREYGLKLEKIFDTMWAARILGYSRLGLASLLEQFYNVKLNKKYQKANWCHRPLSEPQLAYARMDTHYLLGLRDKLALELEKAGRMKEAQEIFAQLVSVQPSNNEFDPDGFWSVNGVRKMDRRQQAIARALFIYRDQQAKRLNRPHFKVFPNKTLVELARTGPTNFESLGHVYGMSQGQIRRYGRQILQVIQEGQRAPLPAKPRQKGRRPPIAVSNRYEQLTQWRRERAQDRGVESDVIMSREALWDLAKANPRSEADLADIDSIGPWRRETYGAEIVRLLTANRTKQIDDAGLGQKSSRSMNNR
jgi:ribonuclease D